MAIELMDSDGENRAVRAFLLLYGTNAKTTVGDMAVHLRRSGFPHWPDWVNTEHPVAHLTKAGAQLWLRHLLALEPGSASLADAQAEIARLRGALEDQSDTIRACFKAVGYTEEYALQWPKEKASVTFKRWFDEQVSTK